MSLEQILPFFYQHEYVLIFFSAFFESVILTSFLLPGSLVVLFAGYMVTQGRADLATLFVCAFCGVFVGDLANYYLGFLPWQRLLKNNKMQKWVVEHEKKASFYLTRFGLPIIVYVHLLGYFRSFICFTAGFIRLPLHRYIITISIASLVWTSAFLFTGYFLGITQHDIKDVNQKLQFFFVGLFVVFILFKVGEKKLQSYLEQHSKKGNKKNS